MMALPGVARKPHAAIAPRRVQIGPQSCRGGAEADSSVVMHFGPPQALFVDKPIAPSAAGGHSEKSVRIS